MTTRNTIDDIFQRTNHLISNLKLILDLKEKVEVSESYNSETSNALPYNTYG